MKRGKELERVMAQMEQLEQCVWTLTCQMDRMKSDERREGKESARTGGYDKGRLPEEGMHSKASSIKRIL